MLSTIFTIFTLQTMMGQLDTSLPSIMPWGLTKEANISELKNNFPTKDPIHILPVIKAKSAIAVDLDSGAVLYQKNISEPLPIASITKLITSLVILDENKLDEQVTVSLSAAKVPGSKIWLAPDEKLTVESLLSAVLIASANDAATALAEYNSKNNLSEFIDKMNKKAAAIGMKNSRFFNPTGLDQSSINTKQKTDSTPQIFTFLLQAENINSNSIDLNTQSNYSTAYDLALLGQYAFQNSFVKKHVVQQETQIEAINGKLKHKLKNTNDLLKSYLKVLGLKTGTTDEAGACLISIIENNQGHKILTVVLNSPNRYNETKIIVDFIFKAYSWN